MNTIVPEPLVSKDTVVKVSISSLIGVETAGFYASSLLNTHQEQLTDRFDGLENRLGTVEIVAATNREEIIKTSLRIDINGVIQKISDLERELRELRRHLRDDPANDLIIEHIATVEKELEKFEDALKCYQRQPDHPELCHPKQ